MRLGFIGAGMVGQMHLSQYKKMPEIYCVALAELRPELGDMVAKKHNIPSLYNNHCELLEKEDVDAVVVVTHRNSTSKVVYDCLDAGKHVFSEKPMAKTLAHANKLVQAAENKQLSYVIGYQKRHDEAALLARNQLNELLASKELGELTSMEMWNYTGQDRDYTKQFQMSEEPREPGINDWQQEPEWLESHFSPLYDRFINVFCHDINAIRFLLNKDIDAKSIDLTDEQNITLSFSVNDLPVKMHCGLRELNDWRDRGEWDEGVSFHFEQGSLSIAFPGPLLHGLSANVVKQIGDKKIIIHRGQVDTPVFYKQAENFIGAISNNFNNPSLAQHCVNDLVVIENLWKIHQGMM